MGLPIQLSELAPASFTLFMVGFIARSVNYLHSLFLTILSALGLYSLNDAADNLMVLCSYPNHSYADSDPDCIVCMECFAPGDQVSQLPCRHVFHKDCLHRWLDQLNFKCPLCRAPLLSHDYMHRSVAGDLH